MEVPVLGHVSLLQGAVLAILGVGALSMLVRRWLAAFDPDRDVTSARFGVGYWALFGLVVLTLLILVWLVATGLWPG
jgi:hypothetical protein